MPFIAPFSWAAAEPVNAAFRAPFGATQSIRRETQRYIAVDEDTAVSHDLDRPRVSSSVTACIANRGAKLRPTMIAHMVGLGCASWSTWAIGAI